jgi:uncharacterized protein YciI
MPLYALHALDRPNTLPLRMEYYAEHRAFAEDAEALGVKIIMSGPLQSDDGEIMTGSLFLLEAADRAAVEAFVSENPFTKHDVWGEVSIRRFYRRVG